jgi:hypothetical protein
MVGTLASQLVEAVPTHEAEVQELDGVLGQEHVRRLQVAVQQPAAVQGAQAVQQLERDPRGLGGRQRSPRQALRERLAFEELHDDVGLARLLADLEDLAHVGVVDPRGGARLAAQALACLLVAALVRDHLDGDDATQVLVKRGIDDSHAARAQLFRDAVVTDGGAVARHRPPQPAQHRQPASSGSFGRECTTR